MPDDTMIAAKAADGFKTESPIRAFTNFQVAGSYAIGKGFRPSLAHLTRYLDAMLAKEGWGVLQIILPRDSDGEPTILFERCIPSEMVPSVFSTPERERRNNGRWKDGWQRFEAGGDPVNPKHYAGRECADIGERLSANGYQVLKYCWRLGKKDDPCVELGKALWYLDSEVALLSCFYPGDDKAIVRPNIRGLAADAIDVFLEERIVEQPAFTQNVARMLWDGYGQRRLQSIREAIEEQRFHMDCGRGLAI